MTTAADPGMRVLSEQAERLGLHLTGDQLGQFSEYTRLLSEGNRRANLTAITDPEQVQVRHYLDSLTAVLAVREWPDGTRVVDIGAGAGFPGRSAQDCVPRHPADAGGVRRQKDGVPSGVGERTGAG